MKILYFDCFSGISGDMILGGLLDLGLDIAVLKKELSKLPFKGYKISTRDVRRAGIRGRKFIVDIDRKYLNKSRTPKEITTAIKKSKLSAQVKGLSLKIFDNLAEAESRAHGFSKQKVHFHHVGDIDSIIDIVGSCIGLEALGIEKVYASSLNVGSGTSLYNGRLQPVPAPATAFLLEGLPAYSQGENQELVTPTGCAVLKSICDEFMQLPNMKIEKVGYGAGTYESKQLPNLLRLIAGSVQPAYKKDKITVLETNIDDMNPIATAHLIERLFKAGVLDAFYSPVYMKKMRMGILLTVLAEHHILPKAMDVIFNETTTLGLRTYQADREKLDRTIKVARTKFGNVKVKIGKLDGHIKTISPEYEDCKRVADKAKISFRTIYEEAKRIGTHPAS